MIPAMLMHKQFQAQGGKGRGGGLWGFKFFKNKCSDKQAEKLDQINASKSLLSLVQTMLLAIKIFIGQVLKFLDVFLQKDSNYSI